MPKPTPIPLSTFLGDTPGDVGVPESDQLPSGPAAGGNGDGSRTHKWIAEWGGREELVPDDAAAAGGGGAACASVDDFKSSVDLLLREFLVGGDLLEAARCVTDLAAPQFHFQLVKRAVTLAMDKEGREREMVAVLLASLHARDVLTSEQATTHHPPPSARARIPSACPPSPRPLPRAPLTPHSPGGAQAAEGFRALIDGIDDLKIDIPTAPSLLSHFVADAHLDGLLPLE